MTFNGF